MPQSNPRNGVSPTAEFGQIRAYLAIQGVSQGEITTVIGTGAQGRSRAEIAELLRLWMRNLPKAQG